MVIAATIVLLLLSAALSGLMAALVPLDVSELQRKAELGHLQARAVLPLRERGNQLFVTLLIADTLVNAGVVALVVTAIQPWLGVLYAMLLIIAFGEVAPRAIFGRYGLRMGTTVAPAVGYLMQGLYPLARPLGLLLDWALGRHASSFMSRDELVKLIQQHSQSEDSNVSEAELTIVEHALTFSNKRIADHMTPREKIVSVKEKDRLTLKLMNELHESGHARVPVIADSLDHVSGILHLHSLEVQPHKQKTVADVMEHGVCYLNAESTFTEAISAFMRTKCHLYIVVDENTKTVGLITIEDVIKQLMGKPNTAGFDRYDDADAVARQLLEN